MKVTFLGTSSMVPTKQRGQSAVFVRLKNEGILIDCGEGTQRQLKLAGIKPTKITKILISHWHGDHTFGLPGLLQTIQASGYDGVLEIYGPEGTRERFNHLRKAYILRNELNVKINDIERTRFYEGKDFYLEALPLSHSTRCLGFALVEKDKRRINVEAAKKLGLKEGPLLGRLQKGESVEIHGKSIRPEDVSSVVGGKKLAYVVDTVYTENCVKLANAADLLICEATFANELAKKAVEHGHMTAREAGEIAKKADVKKLVLTHFSPRYKTTVQLERDVKKEFRNVVLAKDFMELEL